MGFYQDIVETVPIFFFVWDINHKKTIFLSNSLYNARVDDYESFDPKEDLRQYISEAHQPDYDQFFENLAPDNQYKGEITLQTSDNLENIDWVHIETFPIKNRGKFKRLAGHIRDVTREYEDYESLSDKAGKLDAVAFLLAHELSAPVANIMGLADFLKARASEQDQDDFLYLYDTIYNFGGEIMTLGRGLISLITLQDLKSDKIRKEELQLQPFLEKELEEFYHRNDKKRIGLEFNFSGQMRVWADREKLKMAIGELLLYLIKMSDEATNIHFSTPDATSQDFDDLCMYVNDPDLPKESLQQVLDSSTRLQLPDVQGKKLTGMLELVIAKEIIELHKGKLSLYEADGNQGFLIQLPAWRKRS